MPTQNDTDPIINGSFPKIDNLEYFPAKVLLHIFSKVDDGDLLHLSDCSHRFEDIAKLAFKIKYANKYFVFEGDSKSKRKMYLELFSRFGRYAEIKAIEVQRFKNIDENHWLPQMLRQHTNQLTKLSFYGCSFERINRILAHHINISHLIIRSVIWKGELILPDYHNLKVLDLGDNACSGFIKGKTIVKVMRMNPTLETLNLSRMGLTVSIYCIAVHLENLKELNMICAMKDDWEISDETMDLIANALMHLESLSLTIDNHEHIELIRRLASKCNNLKQLKLYHSTNDLMNSSDEIIQIASQFQAVECLELIHLRNYDSIRTLVEYLPNLHHLRDLKLFMDTPQRSNKFIPSLSSKCASLKTITITSWNDTTLSWPMFFFSTAIFKEIIKTAREPPRSRIELKDFEQKFGFATNKQVIWCNERSQWIANDSIFFSFSLVFLFFGIIFLIFYTILLLGFFDLYYYYRKPSDSHH